MHNREQDVVNYRGYLAYIRHAGDVICLYVCQASSCAPLVKSCGPLRMQGLDLDAAGGVAVPGTRLSREEEIRRQRAWAEQTDTRLAGVAEQMTIARDNVAHTAGRPWRCAAMQRSLQCVKMWYTLFNHDVRKR
jgi:hypothetical protein